MNAREVVIAQYAWEAREAERAARVAAIEAGGETLIELADTEEADVMATVEADEVARFLRRSRTRGSTAWTRARRWPTPC